MTAESWSFAHQLLDAFKAIALAYLVYQTAKFTKTVVTLEKNTNSIKDALIVKTDEAAFARGVKHEADRPKD